MSYTTLKSNWTPSITDLENGIDNHATGVPMLFVRMKKFYKRCFYSLPIDDRVIFLFTVTAIFFVGIFVPIRYLQDRVSLAVTNLVIVCVMATVHGLMLRGHTAPARTLFVAFITVIMVVVVYLTGAEQLNWIYPAGSMLFFSLKPRQALTTNLAVVTIIGALLIDRVPLVSWLQDIISLYCSVTITFIFSYLLHRHNAFLEDEAAHHRRIAHKDALTGLPNRRAFELESGEAVARCRNNGNSAALIIIDVDHFKTVNDTYGHGVGDLVLQKVASLLQGAMRAGEGVYRLGGEEFAVMLADVSRSVAEECGERIRKAVDNAHFDEIPDALDRQHKTISLGIAIYLTGESISDWFERADNALYAAKNTGRNKLCVAA